MIPKRNHPAILLPLSASLIVFGTSRGEWVLPSLSAIFIVAGFRSVKPVWLSKKWLIAILIIIGVIFSYCYGKLVKDTGVSLLFLSGASINMISVFCILFIVYSMFAHALQCRETPPLCAAFALASLSGNVIGSKTYLPYFGVFFIALLIYMFIEEGRSRLRSKNQSDSLADKFGAAMPVTAFFIVSIVTAGALALLLSRTEKIVEYLGREIVKIADGRLQLNFDSSMKLGSLSRFDVSDDPLMTLDGKGPISEYLRCKTYDIYEAGVWKESKENFIPLKAENEFDKSAAGKSYSINRDIKPIWEYRIMAAVNMGQILPAPYGVSNIVSPIPIAYDTGAATFAVVSDEIPLEYFITGTLIEPASSISKEQYAMLIGIEERAKKQLYPKAVAISGAQTSDSETAKRIKNYFADFEYSLETNIKKGEDPTVDFILNRRKGYCRHFASGAALMLRSLGIPARVAAGFIIRDHVSDTDNTWVVRRRDAHAWCEYYDREKKRWTLLEAAPIAGMNEVLGVGKTSLLSNLFGGISVWIQMTAARLRNFSFSKWLDSFKSSSMLIILPASIFIVFIGSVLFKRKISFMALSDFLGRLRSFNKKSRIEKPRVTTENYLLFISQLEKLGIHVRDSDTGEDIIVKIEKSLPDSHELFSKCREFINIYYSIRFRAVSDVELAGSLSRLEKINSNILEKSSR